MLRALSLAGEAWAGYIALGGYQRVYQAAICQLGLDVICYRAYILHHLGRGAGTATRPYAMVP